MRGRFVPPAFIAAPGLVVLGLFYLKTSQNFPYYGLSDLLHAISVTAVVCPVAALLSAIEGHRVRAGDLHRVPGVRSRVQIAARALFPVVLSGFVAVAIPVILVFARGGSVASPFLPAVLIPLIVVSAHALVGYTLGLALRPQLAVPIAAVGSWLVCVYPVAMTPLWIRHLTGTYDDCCDIAAVPAAAALVAPVVLGVGVAVAALVVISIKRRYWVRIAVAAAIIAGSAAVAVSLVDGLGFAPQEPRPIAELSCAGHAPRLCLWPEHEAKRAVLAEQAAAIARGLAQSGVRTPPVASEAAWGRADWNLGTSLDADRETTTGSLLSGLLPGLPRCAAEAPNQPYPADAVRPVLEAWLALRAGVDRQEADPATQAAALAVAKRPDASQARWFAANARALEHCRVHPVAITP